MAMAPCSDAVREPTAVVAIFNVNMIGHLNPTFALVQELVARGCRVHYFLPPAENIREAAREAGATVEPYMRGDPQDYVLETRGCEAAESIAEEDRAVWIRCMWPLASTLESGDYLVERCRELCVDVVLFDPMAPHGLLVAEVLSLPAVSLVTYPGMGSLADLMSNTTRLEYMKEARRPLAEQIRQRFRVDLQDQLLTRRQYFSHENFVTTSEDLVTPLPPQGVAWADELREKFLFTPIGCMVSESAPHVMSAKKPEALIRASSFGHDLPVQQLKAARARGAKVIFVALGTMALSTRWEKDLGLQAAGNLPNGTTGKAFCQHVWATLFAAMRDLGDAYHCVLSVGSQADALDFLDAEAENAKPQEDVVPSNVSIRSFVPQVEMLNKYASVFVSHAGFNSMQESLMAGVPLIAVPQAVDQPENARKIEACGWGRAFLEPMTTVTPAALASAMREVSADANPYLAEVSRVREQLQGGHQRAADRLLQLAATYGQN